MNDAPITAEDLALYALHALDSGTSSRVDVLLRSSSEARAELSLIRGDLATLALSAQQHTPPALSRQRLLKQVARERRLPIPMAAPEEQHFALDPADVVDPTAPTLLGRSPRAVAEERRSRVRLPRIVAEPEPMFTADDASSADQARTADTTFARTPADTRTEEQKRAERIVAGLQSGPIEPVEARRFSTSTDTPGTAPQGVAPDAPLASEPALPARSASAAGTLFQMPGVSASLRDTDADDRYTPAIRSVDSEDTPRRSHTAVILAWTGWVAAAGLAAATVLMVRNNTSLQQQMHAQEATLAQTRATTARANAVLQTLESAAAQRFVLARQDTAPMPSARVAYLPERGSLVFQGTNLEQLPPYKTYELWLIPTGTGAQPVAAGTFKPDARGYATLIMPSLPSGTVAGNFGVTIEDETGSTVPTLPILLIGQTG